LADPAINAISYVTFRMSQQLAGGFDVGNLTGGLGADIAELELSDARRERLVPHFNCAISRSSSCSIKTQA
jgi:hypothetical protein